MGTTLTGTTPQDTYDSLIKVTDNGPLNGSLKVLTDGLGNNSTLSLSTAAAKVDGLLSVAAFTTGDLTTSPQLSLTRGATQFTGIAIRGAISADRALFSVGSDDALYIGRHAGGGGAWTKQVSFLDNGDVGIGTTSPSEKLQTQGNVVINKDSTSANFVSKTFTTGHAVANRGGSILFGMNDSTPTGMKLTTSVATDPSYNKQEIEFITHEGAVSAGTRLFINSTGNVGIGTTAPDALLSLSKTADASINVNTSATGTFPIKSGISFGAATTALGSDSKYSGGAGIQGLNIQQADNVTDLILWTTAGGSPSEKVRITSAGNVGFGTSAPTSKLQVTGTGTFISSSATINGSNGITINKGDNTYHNGIFFEGVAVSDLYFGRVAGASDDLVFKRATGNVEVARMQMNNGGISFNGDTAAANALDDYEEGTWTMGVSFGGASVGVTTSANTGTYTKIGRQVTVSGSIVLTSKGSSTGVAEITGLPFALGSTQPFRSSGSFRFFNISFTNQFQGFAIESATTILLREITLLGTETSLDDTNFANDSQIIATLTYFV